MTRFSGDITTLSPRPEMQMRSLITPAEPNACNTYMQHDMVHIQLLPTPNIILITILLVPQCIYVKSMTSFILQMWYTGYIMLIPASYGHLWKPPAVLATILLIL